VIEAPNSQAMDRFRTSAKLIETIQALGVVCTLVDGVPAEGLRRLQASVAPAAYVEPVYLRGFL
jgi:hypothetical protein